MVISEILGQQSKMSPATPSGEDVALVTVLAHTTKVFSAQAAEILGKQGFTLDEWMVLDTIQHSDGSSMSQISAATGCSGASLTRTVDKLVTGALAYREASQVDRRKVEVFLSNRGAEVHRQLSNHLLHLESSVDNLISHSGLDREALVRFLRALHNPDHLLAGLDG